MPLYMNRFWLRQEEAGGDAGGGGGGSSGGAADDKSKGDDGGSGGAGNKGFKTVEDAVKEIERLRKENAGHRTKNKTLDESLAAFNDKFSKINKHLGIEENVDPAEQLTNLTSEKEQLALEVSLQQLARANSIPMEQDGYFRYLIQEKFESLGEEDELSDEQIAEVVAEVQKYSGFKKENPKTSTGLNDKGGKEKPNDADKKDEVTVEAFKKMTFTEKNTLYTKNPELYDKLQAESKRK